MVSNDAILFYVISLLNQGDSSLRFGMTIYYFIWVGKKWRFANSIFGFLRYISANRHFFSTTPPPRRVIPSASEESPSLLTICLQLFRQIFKNQWWKEEFPEFVLLRI